MNVKTLINLWNEKVDGWHKKVRIEQPFLEKKFQSKFKKAKEVLPTEKEWSMVIDETMKLFDQPFWQARRGKHGLDWLFQNRSGGSGVVNYIYYYELALDALEADKEKGKEKEVYTSLFGDQ